MSLLKKSSSLPPLPAGFDAALQVENRRPGLTGDHTTIAVRYEAPSARGAAFAQDRFSVFLDGLTNGHVRLRGIVSSRLAGVPRDAHDSLDLTVPIDVLLPVLIGFQRGAELLVAHEKIAERALVSRGQLSSELGKGWSWF